MKNLIVFLIIVGAVIFLYKKFDKPKPILNPVYGEARVTIGDLNPIEMVIYTAAADEKECQEQLRLLKMSLPKSVTDSCPGPTCKIGKLECKNELARRHLKLFDNEPTFVAYISLAPGASDEREMRIIYWGLPAEMSNQICDSIPEFRANGWKGKIRCIQAAN